MLYQELKRRLFTKYVLLSIIGIFLLTIGLNIILLGGQNELPKIMKEEAIYSGKMTEDKLWLGLKKVRDEKSKEVKYQPLVSYIYGLVSSYPGIMYPENRIEDFKDEYAKDFYKCWKKKSIAIIERIPKQDQKKALKELDKVETPFDWYTGCYFWNFGIDNLQVVYLIIIFMVTFFAASTYSESMENGSMEIIYATRLRKRMMAFRLLPVMMYGILLTLTAILGTVLVLGSVTGLQALKSSFKVFALFSIGNFTLGDGIFLMSISEILGILALTTIMGCISYKTSKTKFTIAIGVAINIFYIMTSFIKIPWRFFRLILNLFPTASSQIIYDIPGFRFDMGIWRPYAVMISMVIMFIVFGILLSHAVCREEI